MSEVPPQVECTVMDMGDRVCLPGDIFILYIYVSIHIYIYIYTYIYINPKRRRWNAR